VALITVLLVVAVLTAIVSRLTLSNEIWIRQVEGGAAMAQARQVARAAEQWVGLLLLKDDNEYDSHQDLWAQPLPPLPVGWGEIGGTVEDMQGRFNLNNLVTAKGEIDPVSLTVFQRLLRVLQLNPGIAEAAVDWIDPDSLPTGGGGAEDSYYRTRKPPYLAANQAFGVAEELRLVRGVDQEAWQALEPHVAALPEATGINVNTASAEVLAAAITQWGPPFQAMGRAREWSKRTDRDPFADVNAFVAEAFYQEPEEGVAGITVQSDFFEAHLRATFGRVEHRLATLYRRGQGRAEIVRHRREIP
jgi:general secretion pathway protein K